MAFAGDMEKLFDEFEIIFSPGSTHTHCFLIVWRDNGVLEENRNFTLLLSSSDEGVITRDAILELQDDDSKKI